MSGPLLALLALLAANPLGPKFAITSVTYTDADGKQQTVAFDANNAAEIPAAAVANDVIIGGIYWPPRALVTATCCADNGFVAWSGAPTLNKVTWTKTLAKETLKTGTSYAVYTYVNGGRPNHAVVNAADVRVTTKELTIAEP